MVKKWTETPTKTSGKVSSTFRWCKLNCYQLELQTVYRHVETPLEGTITSCVGGIRIVSTGARYQHPSTKNNNGCGLICMGRKERSSLKFTSFHLFGKGIMFYLAVCVCACVRTITAGPMCQTRRLRTRHNITRTQASAMISTKERSKTAQRLNVSYISTNPIVTVWTAPPLVFHSSIILTRDNSWIGSSLEIADQRADIKVAYSAAPIPPVCISQRKHPSSQNAAISWKCYRLVSVVLPSLFFKIINKLHTK
jgi:hypothetical protein